MMRRTLRATLRIGVLVGAGYAVWRALERRRSPSSLVWEPRPFPYPPEPHEQPVGDAAPGAPPWIEASDGTCPATHPVKAKLTSGIYHVPGGANYERTRADRCYPTADAAATDGLRPAKR